jgi:DNA-binding response OmpR family regulator
VKVAGDGPQALDIAVAWRPNLIILDILLPTMDGFEVCKTLREDISTAFIPIMMLTARGETESRTKAFSIGTDDYVTKPFSFAEITARAGAVLGRSNRRRAAQEIISTGDLQIDLVKRRVSRAGNPIDLTPTEFRLLETLARHLDMPIPSQALVDKIWGPAYAGEVEHVKHYIWLLRRKLENDPGDPKHLLTERGFGYRLS